MAKKKRGVSGSEAERLCERWLRSLGYLVHRAQRSVKRWPKRGAARCTKCGSVPEVVMTQQHDLWGCIDLLAFAEAGQQGAYADVWLLQVTTQAGRSTRRRKLEEVSWPLAWRVSLVSHEKTVDPAHRGRRLHWWKYEDLLDGPVLDADGVEIRRAKWSKARAVQFDPKSLPLP